MSRTLCCVCMWCDVNSADSRRGIFLHVLLTPMLKLHQSQQKGVAPPSAFSDSPQSCAFLTSPPLCMHMKCYRRMVAIFCNLLCWMEEMKQYSSNPTVVVLVKSSWFCFWFPGRRHQIRSHLAFIGHPLVGCSASSRKQTGYDVDLKVLVRSFNCESRACYVGNPRESFFFELAEENFLFAKVSRKLDIMDHYHCIHYSLFRATTSCRPGAQGPAGEWYRTFTFPFIGSSQASEGEASPQPNNIPWFWSTSLHLPLVLPSVAFWSLKKQAPHAAAKLPKVRLCESQTPRPLVFAVPLMRPLLMAGVRR